MIKAFLKSARDESFITKWERGTLSGEGRVIFLLSILGVIGLKTKNFEWEHRRL